MRCFTSLLLASCLGFTAPLHAARLGIATDKAAHFGLSSVGTEALIKGCHSVYHLAPITCHIWASSIMTGLGAFKEWDDQRRGGRFDPQDLTADMLGVITSNLLQWQF